LLYNVAFDYAVMRVQVNEDGLKLNGKHQFLAYVNEYIMKDVSATAYNVIR